MKKYFSGILLILTMIIFIKCKNEENVIEPNEISNDFFVSETTAIDIAESISINIESQSSRTEQRKVKSIKSYKDKNNNNAFYVINYGENDGWIILSADKRIEPILAEYYEGSFPIDGILPPALEEVWMSDILIGIENIRYENMKPQESYNSIWNRIENGSSLSGRTLSDPNCPYEGYEYCVAGPSYGPLMGTQWRQSGEDFSGCEDYDFNGYISSQQPCYREYSDGSYYYDEYSVGCGGIAVGQVMNYHEKPNGWNYNYHDYYACDEVKAFLKFVADGINSNYSCSGTSANYWNTVSFLKNQCGYASNTYFDPVNYSIIDTEITSSRPVIVTGLTGGNCISFNGHWGVIEGKRTFDFYRCEMNPYTGELVSSFFQSYKHYFMNWGWGRFSGNGWYSFNNWYNTTTGDEYNA